MDKGISRSTAYLHALGALTRPVIDRITYTTRSGIAAGLKRRGGYGFIPRQMSDEERFYLSLELTGKTIYDVGSYEGIFSLFAARAIGHTGALVVFEPHPESYGRTKRNLELNNFGCNIIMRNVALGAGPGVVTMSCPGREPARATLNTDIADKLSRDGEVIESCQARVESLDDAVATGLPIAQFLKIDTEGYEYEVIRGAERTLRQHGPDLFIELHGIPGNWLEFRGRIDPMIRMIKNCGYSLYNMYRKPVSGDELVTHLYCTKS